jgi:hypothetical protein
LFRFGEEEDGVVAKSSEFQRGGEAVLRTMTESWSERLSHEHGKLTRKLKEEKEHLRKATEMTRKRSTEAWDKLVHNENTANETRHVDLMARVAALQKKIVC